MRSALPLVLLLLTCAEAKNQVRLGFGGAGAYAPRQPDRPAGAMSTAPLEAVGAAVGSAVVSRVTGGCVAYCPPGTACNEQTGLCDTMPCRDACKPDEICQGDRCVPMLLPGLKIEQKQKP